MTAHPQPTAWPAALALGVTLAAAGLITSPLLVVLGGVIALAALIGWIDILTHEEPHP